MSETDEYVADDHGADATRPRVIASPAEIAHAMLMLTAMEPPHADCDLCKRLAERFAISPPQPPS